MGTNYYIVEEEEETCVHCGHTEPAQEAHIGKASGGWKFLFDGNRGLTDSFKKIQELIAENPDKIRDEYGKQILPKEFFGLVEAKQDGMDIADYIEKYKDDIYIKANRIRTDVEYYCEDGYRFSTVTDFS